MRKFTFAALIAAVIASLCTVVGIQSAATASVIPTSFARISHAYPDLGLNDAIVVECYLNTPVSRYSLAEGDDSIEVCNNWPNTPYDGGTNDDVDRVYVSAGHDLSCLKGDGVTWHNKWKATGWHNVVNNGFVYQCKDVEDATPGF